MRVCWDKRRDGDSVQGQGGKERNQRITALGDSRERKVVVQTGSCTRAVEVREGQVNLLAGGLSMTRGGGEEGSGHNQKC